MAATPPVPTTLVPNALDYNSTYPSSLPLGTSVSTTNPPLCSTTTTTTTTSTDYIPTSTDFHLLESIKNNPQIAGTVLESAISTVLQEMRRVRDAVPSQGASNASVLPAKNSALMAMPRPADSWVSPSAPLLYSRPHSPPPQSPSSESDGSEGVRSESFTPATAPLPPPPPAGPSTALDELDMSVAPPTYGDLSLLGQEPATASASSFEQLLSMISANQQATANTTTPNADCASPTNFFDRNQQQDDSGNYLFLLPQADLVTPLQGSTTTRFTANPQPMFFQPPSATIFDSVPTTTTTTLPPALPKRRRSGRTAAAKPNTRRMVEHTEELIRRGTELLSEYQNLRRIRGELLLTISQDPRVRSIRIARA